MATFADYVLLSALPSYGGAEVRRARRVRNQALEPPVHLALFGPAPQLERPLIQVADGNAQIAHDAVARIVEVGRFDGSLYAVAEAAEGVDLAAVLEFEKRRRGTPETAFVIGVVYALTRVVFELHERGDVWADRAPGLSGLFPAGFRPDCVVLRKDGAVLLRVLAGAGADVNQPNAFRAPELGRGPPSVAADVYALVQLLRALLASDVTASASPRVPTRGGVLPTLLVAALQESPDDRPGLELLMERLRDVFADNAANQSPAGVIAAALRREYRSLVPEDSSRDGIPPDAVASLARHQADLAAARVVLFPLTAQASAVPAWEADGGPTVATRRSSLNPNSAASDAVDRVFTEEGAPDPASEAPFSDISVVSETGPAAPVPSSAPHASMLDLAAATFGEESEQTQKLMRGVGPALAVDPGSSSQGVPWVSLSEVVPLEGSDDAPAVATEERPRPAELPPFAAPAALEEDFEAQDTIKMSVEKIHGRGVPRDISLQQADTDKALKKPR